MWTSWLLSTLLLSSLALADDQQPLLESKQISKDELIRRLKYSLIVPDILDEFLPTVKLEVSWKNASADYGNTIDPDELQKEPHVTLHDWREYTSDDSDLEDMKKKHKKHKKKKPEPEFIVALTDPDAPSFEDPKWSQMCHWILADVKISRDKDEESAQKAKSIIDYKPPGPPPKTGRHRYIAVVLTARNGTTDKLHLSTPSDRQHWGYDGDRTGVREWAHENGLAVVGANFILAQNHKQ